MLSDGMKVALLGALVVLGYLFGYLVLGAWSPDFRILPIPEEFSRDGSGRLADIIPGDWEVLCYVVPYGGRRQQVAYGLRQAHISSKYAADMPEFFLGENEFAFVTLRIGQKPRVLLIDDSRKKDFYFTLNGEQCHTRTQAGYDVEASEKHHSAKITIASRD